MAEADDVARPDFLETCVRLAEAHADTSICYAGSQLIDEEGTVQHRDINHWGRRARREHAYFQGSAFAEHNLYWKNYTVNASGILPGRLKLERIARSLLQEASDVHGSEREKLLLCRRVAAERSPFVITQAGVVLDLEPALGEEGAT